MQEEIPQRHEVFAEAGFFKGKAWPCLSLPGSKRKQQSCRLTRTSDAPDRTSNCFKLFVSFLFLLPRFETVVYKPVLAFSLLNFLLWGRGSQHLATTFLSVYVSFRSLPASDE
jgi:hypothetical protein